MIDNEKQLLKVGEPEKLGVKLVKATDKYVALEVDDTQSKYLLSSRVPANCAKQDKKEVLVYRDSDGMFKTTGSHNGYTIDFMVDTGASAVVLHSNLTKRLGLQYKLNGHPTSLILL